MLALLLLTSTSFASFPPAQEAGSSGELKAAIERSLPLLQSTLETWTQEQGCISCHHQALGTMAVTMARDRGFRIDRALHERQVERMLEEVPLEALQGRAGINGTFGRSYQLLALAAAGNRRDARHEVLTRFVIGNVVEPGDRDDVYTWLSTSYRPPLEASGVTATALAVRAIDLFAHPAQAEEAQRLRIGAARWLAGVEPRDGEERAMRLLGLAWSGAAEELVRDARGDLLGRQRPDGGWAQIPTDASDAYATGQALVALQQVGGLDADSDAFQRGVDYLLDSQLEDGSWLVETRRQSPGLPYFETGFPHRLHQFISTAATAWATMALLIAVDPAPAQPFRGPRPEAGEHDLGLEPVHLAAAFGPYAELERLLEAGADPDAQGPDGLRPLHLAVHDPRAVTLLLEHGAATDPRSETGTTPLMLAAWYGSDDRAAHALIARGAEVDVTDATGGSALTAAVDNGKHGLIRTLVERGVTLTGLDPDSGTLLHRAATGDDVATARLLLELGVPADASLDQVTPLHWAAYDGKADMVALLLAAGADPNARDDEGMTPLNWAAKVEHGDGRTVELLLQSGADPSTRGLMDRTPLEWARSVGNEPAQLVLERALAETEGR